MEINKNSTWAKQPDWKKRINGVVCYFICMVVSLWNPIAVDMALYKNLKEQFIEK